MLPPRSPDGAPGAPPCDAGASQGDRSPSYGLPPAATAPVRATRWLCILWPAFMMAGVLEMLVFAVLDPQQLHWFGAEPVAWESTTLYSVAFFAFWLAISLASAITQYLVQPHVE
jgi:hypothetical protein